MLASGELSPMRSRRPSSFSACSRTSSGMPASAIFVRYSSTTDASSSPSSLRIDSIWRRRMYSRCCFSTPDSTSSLDALAHLHLGEPLALELEGELEPLEDVDGLEQLDLLLEGQVGRVARRVGERAGLRDRADERRDAAVVAAQLEDLLDDGAVLALELADLAVGRDLVGPLLDLDEEPAAGSRSRRRRRRRGAGRSARRRGRRRAAGRCRSPRRRCRRWRTRPRASGRAGRGSRRRRRPSASRSCSGRRRCRRVERARACSQCSVNSSVSRVGPLP